MKPPLLRSLLRFARATLEWRQTKFLCKLKNLFLFTFDGNFLFLLDSCLVERKEYNTSKSWLNARRKRKNNIKRNHNFRLSKRELLAHNLVFGNEKWDFFFGSFSFFSRKRSRKKNKSKSTSRQVTLSNEIETVAGGIITFLTLYHLIGRKTSIRNFFYF